MNLNDVPGTAEAPADAQPSAVVARIRAVRPSRRAVLRGLVIAGAAAALVPLDWLLTRRDAAAAPSSDSPTEWPSCQPSSYDEEANNWPPSGPAVCYGGYRRGSYPCQNGYHREGAYDGTGRFSGEKYQSTRMATNCEGRNAWRWHDWRCSDAMTYFRFSDGTDYTSVTIAACGLTAAEKPQSPSGGRGPQQPDKPKGLVGGLVS